MKILLFSMPDATHPLYPRFCRAPNLGLASLAGMLKGDADVRVADLVLRREDVAGAVREALEEVRPDLVGLSAMTFQYYTATRIAGLVRAWNPEIPIALGGYHATMSYRDIAEHDASLFDFIVRGEAEYTLLELVRALGAGKTRFEGIAGLSWRRRDPARPRDTGREEDDRGPKHGAEFRHNADRTLAPLRELPRPDRRSRLWRGYHIHGLGFDMAETSRGCTLPCNFCSITKMYGRSFRPFPMDRLLADLTEAADLGAEEIFFADDNITLYPEHLDRVCRALAESGLKKRLRFSTQASVAGLGRDLSAVGRMAEAGFNLVFLGIENVTRRNLLTYRKGDNTGLAAAVIDELRRNRMMIMGGFILGSPDDRAEDLLAQFRFMEEHALDSYLVQVLTPYPGTPMTEGLEREGLVVNRDLRRYSGHFANVRTRHLSSRQLDFLRWKHFPYYRSVRWFRKAMGPRLFPLAVALETVARFKEGIVEKALKRLVSEDYAFERHMRRYLGDNLFFGEKPELRWPDEEQSPPAAPAREPALPVGNARY